MLFYCCFVFVSRHLQQHDVAMPTGMECFRGVFRGQRLGENQLRFYFNETRVRKLGCDQGSVA